MFKSVYERRSDSDDMPPSAANMSPVAMSIRRAIIAAAIAALLFAAVAGVAVIVVGVGDVAAEFRRVGWSTVAGLVAIWVIAFASRAWRWWRLGTHLGVTIAIHRAAVYYASGFAFTTTPGRIGEAFRLWVLRRIHGIPVKTSMPLLIGDRLSDLCCILAMSLIGGSTAMQNREALIPAIVLSVLILAMAVWPALLVRALGFAFVFAGRRRPRVFAAVRRALRNLGRLFGARIFLMTYFPALGGWMLEALMLVLILAALGASLDLASASAIIGLSMLAGVLPFLPGGLGGVEVAMVALLVGAGIPAEKALTATIVYRSTTYWLAVVSGIASLPLVLSWLRRGDEWTPAN